MITLFVIFAIICLIIMSKKDKHNVEEDAAKISQLPAFTVVAKQMSTFSKIVNLAINKSEILHSFAYSNAAITITLENGKSLSALLSDLFVDFEKQNGVIVYTIKGGGKKISFYQTTNITNQEWDAINGVLCLAGSTRGRSLFSKGTKTLGYINTALKAIKAIS